MAWHVRCQSGLMGWRGRLAANYGGHFELFERYDGIYDLARRLGYHNAEAAWASNPIVEGSVVPSDYRKVRD